MKHPGTAGSMPVKGTTCGIRPDLDEMSQDTGFDFSEAKAMLEKENQDKKDNEKAEPKADSKE